MQQNYYVYLNKDLNISIEKMPIWFKVVGEVNGDKNQGALVFHTNNDYDDAWGANAKMDVSWEKKERTEFLHAKEVQKSIDMYNALKIVVAKKERVWLRSHEFTYWFGTRTKTIRKRYYPEYSIHGVFYCDVSERQFDIHTSIIKKHYEGFKPYILGAYNSFVCHE